MEQPLENLSINEATKLQNANPKDSNTSQNKFFDENGNEISKNAQKKLQKMKEREKKRADAIAAKEKLESSAKKEKKVQDDLLEETDPTKFHEVRSEQVKKWNSDYEKFMASKQGKDEEAIDKNENQVFNPYPHKFETIIDGKETHMSIPHFRHTYKELKKHERKEDVTVSLTGRIHNIRIGGSSLRFFDLVADDGMVQLLAQKNNQKAKSDSKLNDSEDFEHVMGLLKRGDIIGARGNPGKSKTGEISLYPSNIELLSPCLHMLPGLRSGLKEQEIRYRQRYLDLVANPQNRSIFYTRSKIINFIRRFFDELGFLEVETPVLNVLAGGAIARPFKTHHNDLNLSMYMRIASELYLKMLIVGGLDRVYEIGRMFRNEGIDLSHNPEFTSLEFYQAYKDYEDLMVVAEELLSKLVFALKGSYKIKYHLPAASSYDGETDESTKSSSKAIEIDFTPPFKRIRFIEGIEKGGNFKIPVPYDSEETRIFLDKKCIELDIHCSEPRTNGRLLDKLSDHFIESEVYQPTFVIDHPVVLSPLAKNHRDNSLLVERQELFIAGKEIINTYTELNNPVVQRQRFMDQMKDRDAGDCESMVIDEGFCKALEYGMPPTAGFGLGIDRLTMLLTDTNNIKEVLLFPAMKPEKD